MKFEYHNPIKFYFGTDVFEKIPQLCDGRKVMLVYGGGSIKETGIYEQITTLLAQKDISYIEYGNQIMTTYKGILDGIALAKKEEIDAVIEIGGASAMDTGKAIAFGAVHDNLEDYREALVPAYLQWLKGISKYHMDDIRTFFIEVLGVDSNNNDEDLVSAGYEVLKQLMEKSGVPLSLRKYGEAPSKEYIMQELEPEDFGEFTQEEMYQMIKNCYEAEVE